MSTPPPLTLGYSPCPNDTFIFHALTHGLVNTEGLQFAAPCLEDVETLNLWALSGRLDVTKLSFHAYGHVEAQYALLAAGAALGRGCGPLLVTCPEGSRGDLANARIAIPGRFTTAAMLLRLFLPGCLRLQEMRFDRIMPALATGEVEAGVIIHESRFTYKEQGLVLVEDLGAWWERETGLPIPLGGIAAKRSLGEKTLSRIEGGLRASLRWAWANRAEAMPTIRRHAQELADAVITSHIDLYVNRFSEELGEEGRTAVAEFLRRGREAGIFSQRRPA